jgi:hypothetical protein
MTLHFTSGFKHKSWLYGWHNKKLYRLPQFSNNYFYPLKEIPKINVGKTWGYRIKRDKLSWMQIQSKTILIDVKIDIIKDSNTPF